MENSMEIINVRKCFRRNVVLNSISCKLENGTYGLLGPNGAGKTTLMRCMTGLYSYNGRILYNGKNIKKVQRMSQIGYLPQKFGLYPQMTVEEMMQYMCYAKKISKVRWKEEVKRCLEAVNLEDCKKRQVQNLSGGMVRRVGIAQALLGDPGVILLDEPTAGLDPEERMRFKEVVNNLQKDKIVIVSTHIVEDVEACCDHIIVIDKGTIVKVGKIEEIRDSACNRIIEIDKEHMEDDNILYVEKSYLCGTEKRYRAITTEEIENALAPTVEDGYLWLLKKN